MKVVFRVDGNKKIGLGHIMRCLALADSLRKMGAEILFITKNYDKKIVEKISEKCHVKVIPKHLDTKEDLKSTIKLFQAFNVDIIITDSYDIDEEYLNELKNTGVFLISIDDLNKISFPSDIVINPNLFAENLQYKTKDSKYKYLLGPKYFMFRTEFIKPRKKARLIRKHANRVLVSMGGSDLQDLTIKVIRALSEIENLNVKIVAGPAYDSISDLKHIVSELKNYEIVVNPENIAELMLWCDLAVIAGGLTKYELAVTGTPGIAIAQAEHQIKLCKDFEKIGAIKYLGFGRKVKEALIANTVKRLLADVAERSNMSEKGKKLVDGKGVERVIEEILAEHKKWLKNKPITLRFAEQKDCRLLWRWRNDPETRINSFNMQYVPYTNHKAWFEKSLKSRERVILIVMHNNTEIGEIRFDVKKDKSAEISVCVAPEQRGKGFGERIIKKGTEYALNNLKINSITARVKKGNKRSVKAFSKAGFKIIKKDGVITTAFCKPKK